MTTTKEQYRITSDITIPAYLPIEAGSIPLSKQPLPQDFRGPQAKPHRMALLTAGCVLGAVETWTWGTAYVMPTALLLITIGTLWTCVARTRAIAQALETRSA